MIGAIRAEYLKLVTVRTWWVLALTLMAYVGFIAALLAGVFGAGDQLGATANTPPVPDDELPPLIYSTATAVGYVLPVILGAISVTSEFRYQTLTPTFLAGPRRGMVLAAKIVVLAAAGAVFGVVGCIASIGLGASVLGFVGIDAALGSPDTWWLAGRMILAMALWAIVGVGVGALIPNQIASIVVVLAFTQFVEPILRLGASIWDWTAQVGRFLPGAAGDALVGSSIYTSLGVATSSVDPLAWWQGGLVLLGLGLAFAVAGYLISWRRDVT